MQSFPILQVGRGSALNKRLFASYLLYQYGQEGKYEFEEKTKTDFFQKSLLVCGMYNQQSIVTNMAQLRQLDMLQISSCAMCRFHVSCAVYSRFK